MPSDALRYAGFWSRLSSLLLDLVIFLPLGGLVLWADRYYRLFEAYYLIPGALFALFYNVYLVRRFGATPGKLLAGIRIRKLDGEPVGYSEAFVRYLPDFVLYVAASVALAVPLFYMSDAGYHSLSVLTRYQRLTDLASPFYGPLRIAQNIWVWGELVVLLTNRKKRALHDFIAGTVVVHNSP